MHKIIIPIVILILLAVAIPVVGVATAKPALTPEPVVEEKIVPVVVTEAAPEPVTSWEEIPLEPDVQAHIVKVCEQYNVRPAIVFAMCKRESNYTVDTIGDSGDSFGLLQIQPKWWYKRMLELNSTNLLDPYHNINVGVSILAELIEKYDGNICAALVAYNAGSYNGTVTEYAETIINEAERIGKVMK